MPSCFQTNHENLWQSSSQTHFLLRSPTPASAHIPRLVGVLVPLIQSLASNSTVNNDGHRLSAVRHSILATNRLISEYFQSINIYVTKVRNRSRDQRESYWKA
ncbi:hypothetical protein NMG60_11006533 [Bertholletia excelsa]